MENMMKQPAVDTGDIMLGGYNQNECFALKVIDDGFAPRILPDDIVIIHRQLTVEDGELAAILLDDDKTPMLRRVKCIKGSGLLLTTDCAISDSGKRYAPIMIDRDELCRVHCLGKVVSLMRDMQSEAVKRDWENARAADDVND